MSQTCSTQVVHELLLCRQPKQADGNPPKYVIFVNRSARRKVGTGEWVCGPDAGWSADPRSWEYMTPPELHLAPGAGPIRFAIYRVKAS